MWLSASAVPSFGTRTGTRISGFGARTALPSANTDRGRCLNATP